MWWLNAPIEGLNRFAHDAPSSSRPCSVQDSFGDGKRTVRGWYTRVGGDVHQHLAQLFWA